MARDSRKKWEISISKRTHKLKVETLKELSYIAGRIECVNVSVPGSSTKPVYRRCQY